MKYGRRRVVLPTGGDWQWIRRRTYLRMRGPRRLVQAMCAVKTPERCGLVGRVRIGRPHLGPIPLPVTVKRRRGWGR